MRLRKLEIKDANLMLEWMHDALTTKYLQGGFVTKTIEDCRDFIKNSQTDKSNLHMAIVDDDDIYMGTVSLKHIGDGAAEFAIVLHPCAMGKGFSRFAMKEIIQTGFRDLQLQMIYWCVNPLNQRAVRFYDKSGCVSMDTTVLYPRLVKTGYTEEQIRIYDWYCIEVGVDKD